MDEADLFIEAEDIMCDQGIISAELNVDFQSQSSVVALSTTRLRVVVTLIAQAVLPAVAGVYYAYLRNQKTVVESVRRQILPTVSAFVVNSISRSLSSVQRGIFFSLRTTYSIAITEGNGCSEPEKCVNCCVLSEPEGPIRADVIFIHGLHGSLVNTWKQGEWTRRKLNEKQVLSERSKSTGDLPESVVQKTTLKRSTSDACSSPPSKIARRDDDNFTMEFEDDEYSKCWPRDWLPKDCPGVRVIALNYTTDPYLWRPLWIKKRNRTSMVERSKEMIEKLLKIGVGKQPIIWVGHSKGGLFVKQIVVYAWENCLESCDLKGIYSQTKGIMFYSVPHKGSSLADFTLPLLQRSIELTEIQRNCSFVLDLHKKFLDMCQSSSIEFSPDIFSFIETSLTLMSFIYLRIVSFDSADPEVGSKWGIPLDHREICKPSSRNCILYQELTKLVNNILFEQS